MKKLNLISSLFLIILFCLLLTQCATSSTKTLAIISPPFKNFSFPSEKITVDPAKGGVVKMKNGTTIEIPVMAFVDAGGKLIETPVTINYEQYASAADVIASGIPMNYDSAGSTIHFESAGMFKINASTTDNKSVQIANGKTLQINMSTNVDGNQYNFYAFDETKGNWVYEGRNEPAPNKEKIEALSSVKECEEPVSPQVARKNAPVFDLNVDYNLYPELKTFEQTLWQCAPGCSEEEVKATSANLQKNFDNIKLESGNADAGIYKLTLYNSDGSFSTNICPVIKEKDIATAKAAYAQKYVEYQKKIEEQKQNEFAANLEGNLYRSFEVAKFGTYNWDCQYHQPNTVSCAVNCKFDRDIEPQHLTYYLISSEEKKVVCYSYDDLKERFAVNPHRHNKILCILDGTKLGVASVNNIETGGMFGRNKTDCYFETLHMAINSVEDLNNYIKSL